MNIHWDLVNSFLILRPLREDPTAAQGRGESTRGKGRRRQIPSFAHRRSKTVFLTLLSVSILEILFSRSSVFLSLIRNVSKYKELRKGRY